MKAAFQEPLKSQECSFMTMPQPAAACTLRETSALQGGADTAREAAQGAGPTGSSVWYPTYSFTPLSQHHQQ